MGFPSGTAARAAPLLSLLLVVALSATIPLAHAASNCSSITGCTTCSYELARANALVLSCKNCSAPAYVLNAAKNRCGALLCEDNCVCVC